MQVSKKSERNWAMVCQLLGLLSGGFIITLVIWLIKRKKSSFINAAGREALNFQISVFIYVALLYFITMLLGGFYYSRIQTFSYTSFFIVGAVILSIFIFYNVFAAAIRTYKGELYRYPFIIRIVK